MALSKAPRLPTSDPMASAPSRCRAPGPLPACSRAALIKLLQSLLVSQAVSQALDDLYRGTDALLGGKTFERFEVAEFPDKATEPSLGDLQLVGIEDGAGFGQNRTRLGFACRSFVLIGSLHRKTSTLTMQLRTQFTIELPGTTRSQVPTLILFSDEGGYYLTMSRSGVQKNRRPHADWLRRA